MKKGIKKKKPFTFTAYTGTKVDRAYTSHQIRDMLAQIGINNIQETQVGNDFFFSFIAQLRNNEAPREVKINLPLTYELDDSEQDKEHKKDVLYRAFYHYIKNKFVGVQRGMKEFEEEFLADLMIVVDGQKVRLGEVLVPKYKKMLKENEVAIFKIKAGSYNQ